MRKPHQFHTRDADESDAAADFFPGAADAKPAQFFAAKMPVADFVWMPVGRVEMPAMPADVVPAPAVRFAHAVGSGEVLAAAPPPVAAAGTSLTQAQVDAFAAGLDATLANIQANVVAQVFADTLPVLGDNLAAAAGGGAAPLSFVTALKDAIVSGLGTLSGSATYTEAQVEGAINSALTAAGITGAGANLNLADMADIKVTFTTGKNFAALSTPIEGDLGLPGLGVSTSGNAISPPASMRPASILAPARGRRLSRSARRRRCRGSPRMRRSRC
jgi:hypothetical protein